MKSRWIRLGVFALLVGILVACGGGTGATSAPTGAATNAQETSAPTTGATDAPTDAAATDVIDGTDAPVDQTAEATSAGGGRVAPMTADLLAPASITVGLQQVAGGMVHPVTMAHARDGSGRLFVADQTGQIYVIGADGAMIDTPFLDVSDRMVEINPGYDERGLLGLAFHPDYANNGRIFVYYSAPLRDGGQGDHTSHLSEFTVSVDDPNAADAGSERVVMQIDQPQANHNGGQIRFGPDGYLYIPLGDGGGANDNDDGHVDDWYAENAGGNGQDTEQNLLGSILRIDVNAGDPYGIPADNPRGDEQWAWGFRNPYSMHFDAGGEGWLLVADAGQNLWEEASVVQAGGNYGWNVMEGTHCFATSNPDAEAATCPGSDPEGNPLMGPVVEYRNLNGSGGIGLVIVGGTIYRGSAIPEMSGMYVFSSWSSSWSEPLGQLFVAQVGAPTELWPMWALPTTQDGMGKLDASVLGFGEDEAGEIYVLTAQSIGPQGETGAVWRIVPADSAGGEVERDPIAAFADLWGLLRYITSNQ